MKKLLFALALLFTIPFNASCVKDITFDVVVICENCFYEKLADRATMACDYEIKLIPIDPYSLYFLEGVIDVETEEKGNIDYLLSEDVYSEETRILTIPGYYVNSKITIKAVGQTE